MLRKNIEDNNSAKLNDKKIQVLKDLFPNCFNEEMLDFAKLEKELSQSIEFKNESYEMNFLGKSYAKYIADSLDTLTTVSPNSEHNELTGNTRSKNLFFTGDNIDVLKHLKKSYTKSIKLIYVDPPYNTGSDGFTYNDNFNFDAKKLVSALGIEESEAEGILQMTSNKSSSHSAWLTFMYPRLYIAHQLLTTDGVFFISIDENEHAQLKLLCDDIFGEENFAGEIIWKNSSKNDQAYISMQHEYILCYVKDKRINKGFWKERKEGLEEIYKAFEKFKVKHKKNWEAIHQEALEWYKQFPDSHPIKSSKHYSWMDKEGVYFPDNISGPNDGQYRYDVTHPITLKKCKEPKTGWRYPKNKILERIAEGKVHFGKDETTVPNNKTYLKNTEYQSLTSVKYKDGRVASKLVNTLIGDKVFTNPKDIDVLGTIIKAIGVDEGEYVLDFFAGSSSTAHAVLKLNAQDKKNRQFIMVQLAEEVGKDSAASKIGYKTIDEISRARINAAVDLLKSEYGDLDIDLGYKHFIVNDTDETILQEIEDFSPTLLEEDFEIDFDRATILATWGIRDGQGLSIKPQEIDLGGYKSYLLNDYLYLIDKGLNNTHINNLLKLYIEKKDFNPTNVILYGYNFGHFNTLTQLENNLTQLKNEAKGIEVSVIKRY